MGCLLSSDGLKSNPAKVEAITKRLKLADVEGAIISYNTNRSSFLSAQKSWNLYAVRGTQREYSSKPHKHSIVERTLVFKQ